MADKTLTERIEAAIGKAADQAAAHTDSLKAMQYSQSAVNFTNSLATLHELKLEAEDLAKPERKTRKQGAGS